MLLNIVVLKIQSTLNQITCRFYKDELVSAIPNDAVTIELATKLGVAVKLDNIYIEEPRTPPLIKPNPEFLVISVQSPVLNSEIFFVFNFLAISKQNVVNLSIFA